jgi:hypothetical protein
MKVGKRYRVVWFSPAGSVQLRNQDDGIYLGESAALGWSEFDVFQFDADGGRTCAIRRERIEQFTAEDVAP